MAKKSKVSSKNENCMAGADCVYSPSLYIDFDELKEVKGLSVGDEVTVVIRGTIKSVEQRESYDEKGKTRASISVKDFEAEIVSGQTQIEALFGDEDD